MIVWWYFLFVVNIISASESILGKSCPYCDEHARRCTPGRAVQNACVRCVCADGTYLCNATACSDEQRENVILGKPTQATCEPRVQYAMGHVTCVCRRDGSWPHEKCELLFKSLHNKTTATTKEPSKRETQRCIPNAYFINDCNVCMCSPEGEVERSRCTRNVCDEHMRRSYDQVHGKCTTGTWYALTSCQICFCHNPSKLVCSANDSDSKYKKIGQYNFTICGEDLLSSLTEIVPASHLQKIGIYLSETDSVDTSTTTTLATLNKQVLRNHPSRADAEESSYDSDSDIKYTKLTVQPFSDSSEEKAQTKDRSGDSNVPDVKIEKKVPKLESNVKNVKHAAREQTPKLTKVAPEAEKSDKETVDKETVDKGTVDKEIDDKETDDKKKNIVISIPSVLQSLLKFALRKSMVKIDVQNDCVVGSAKKQGCNYCFCLNNGKMLCTTKNCEDNQQR